MKKLYKLNGKKSSINKMKELFLITDGKFGVSVKKLVMYKKGFFLYNLDIILESDNISNIQRFFQRLTANQLILNGNFIGFLDYF